MITNDTEYRATQEAVRRFEQALAHSEDHSAHRDPLIQRALIGQIEGELAALRAQLSDYELQRAEATHQPATADPFVR